jgi:hypothetical protein
MALRLILLQSNAKNQKPLDTAPHKVSGLVNGFVPFSVRRASINIKPKLKPKWL